MLIHGSQIRTAMVAMLLCLGLDFANAQDDPSQRPLPLPERGVADLPQHMELLKRLRSLVESQQKNSEQARKASDTQPQLPELPSPADAPSSQQKKNEAAPEKSPFQPQQLQQFQEALKNLASKLPPGFVPPDLSSVPPDQLRKAMENPAVQQQMKQMLEQFAKDGVLPKPGDDGSQLPVPPQNDSSTTPSQNDVIQEGLQKNEPRENKLNNRPSPSNQEGRNKPSDNAQRDSVQSNDSPEVRSRKTGEQNSPGPDESATGESAPSDSETTDSANDAPPGSLRSLRSFLKKLAEDTGMKSPDASQDMPTQGESDSRAAAEEQVMPPEPKNSSSNNSSSSNSSAASPRRPLRKRETSKPKTTPSADSSISPTPNANRNESGQLPGTSPNPLTPPNTSPGADDRENSPDANSSDSSPALPNPSFSSPPQGMKIDPETARKQLEDLQKTLERMKQLDKESNSGRLPTEELPSSNRQPARPNSNDDARSADSNSVSPSPNRNNRIANKPDSDNSNGEQLPESLPDVDEFLREQLKNFKLPPDAFPGGNSGNQSSSPGANPVDDPRGANANNGTPNNRILRNSEIRDLYMERPLQPEDIQRLKNTLRRENTERPGNASSPQRNEKFDKPPIDIAKELEQRGFGDTLKKLVERAKEEAKKPRTPSQNSADTREIAANPAGSKSAIENAMNGASEAAKKADPELSKSMAKMLDGLKDDLVKIAKDARFNDPPERSRSDRTATPPSPSESNSMIDTLRKSASEILAGPSRTPNSGNNAASSPSSAPSAFSGEFDFTPVLVLAGVLAALAVAFFGLRHVKLRSANAAELQFAGPPLKPADINSRADVVRAFHEFALRSAQSVQSWWTHRTVQQAILEKTPEYRAAVETLANTYEQARYLPVEQELSPEQLESARSALQQCSRKNSNG
jgi:hypothetical protein